LAELELGADDEHPATATAPTASAEAMKPSLVREVRRVMAVSLGQPTDRETTVQ
jgi:hypothetical protein